MPALRPLARGLVLTPGASAGRDQPGLVAVDEAATAAGVAVERIEFPYRALGKSRPDPPAVCTALISQEARALADRLGVEPAEVAIGGRSFGGRMCSLAAAEGLPVAALVLISYPLHPPGRPDRLRTEHFPDLRVPCLFVSGTRDAFGAPAELEREAAAIPGPVTHAWIDRGDHSLRRADAEVGRIVTTFLLGEC